MSFHNGVVTTWNSFSDVRVKGNEEQFRDAFSQRNEQDLLEGFRCLNKRCLRLRLNTAKGLHAFRSVLFDYTSLAGLTLGVHASLTGLTAVSGARKGLSRTPPAGSPAHSASPVPSSNGGPGPSPKLAAYHRAAATALLGAYEALQLRLKGWSSLLEPGCPVHLTLVDTRAKLDALCARLAEEGDENRAWEALEEDRELLGTELGVLWEQFLALCSGAGAIESALAQEHHTARVKRFAEGFFMVEDTLHALIATLYTNGLDGESETMPIIFEEKYIHPGRMGRGVSQDEREEGGGGVGRAGLRLALATPPWSPAPIPVQPKPANLDDIVLNTGTAEDSLPPSPTSPLFLSGAGRSRTMGSASEPNLVWGRVGDPTSSDPCSFSLPPIRSKSMSGRPSRLTDDDLTGAYRRVKLNGDALIGEPHVAVELNNTTESWSGRRRSGLGCCLPICANREGKDVVPTTRAATRRHRVLAAFRRRHSSATPSPPDSGTGEREGSVKQKSEKSLSQSGSSSASRRSTLAASRRLTPSLDSGVLEFVQAKEAFKERLRLAGFSGHLSSDFVRQAATTPLFLTIPNPPLDSGPLHLVVCVHGLDGSSLDLRPYRTYLRQGLPNANLEFLMSEANMSETFNDFEAMSKNLVDEILVHLSRICQEPARISFVAHSLGNIIVRAALSDPRLEPWTERLHAYLSLNGPHCGVMFTRAPYDWGMSLVQWWKSSRSLEQLALRDATEPRQSFLFRLSLSPGLARFRYLLLVGSKQDCYVPCHSALIQPAKEARRDSVLGPVYQEMVGNILESLSASRSRPTTLLRYTAFHGLTCMTKSHQVLGRAAHIAVLDDELFIEKLLSVSALQYFA